MPQQSDWFASNAPPQQPQQAPDWFSQNAPEAQPKPTSEPGLFETLGGWKGIGATGIRGLAGLLGVEGGWPGAGIGGLGEAAAELLQEGTIDPRRVGAEAALSAVPLARVFKAGAPVYSALRGGAMGGVGTAIRELTSGQNLDPSAIGASTGLGALTGGVLSKLFSPAVAGEAAQAVGTKPTIPPPQRSETGAWIVPSPEVYQQQGLPVPRPVGQAAIVPRLNPTTQSDAFNDIRKVLGQQINTTSSQDLLSDLDRNAQQVSRDAAQTRAQNFRTDIAASKAEQAADLQTVKQQLAQAVKDARVKAAQGRLSQLVEQGLVNPEKVKESVSFPTSTGSVSVQAPYVGDTESAIAQETAAAAQPTQPAAQEIIPTGNQGSVTTGPLANPLTSESASVVNEARSRVASPSGSEQPPTGEAAEPSSLVKFFKTPGGATGTNYRSATQAFERGEIPSADTARASRLLTIPGREQEGLDLLRKTLGMTEKAPSELPEAIAPKSMTEVPTPGGGPEAPAPSTTATTTPLARPFTPEEVQKENDLVDRAAQMPGSFRENLMRLMQDESGSISPALAHRLMLSVGGAGIGGTYGAVSGDDPSDMLKDAALGTLVANWVAPTAEQEPGLKTMLDNLVDLHRASLLTSVGPHVKKVVGDVGGLLSEGAKQMVPGEYGNSAVGRQIIKNTLAAPLRPSTYKTYANALRGPITTPGVLGAIGDISAEAKNSALGLTAKPFQAAKAVTQDILERSGEYNPDVLDKITGSNMPETGMGQAVHNLIQQHRPLQFMMPFSKLPINITEGVRNIPGISQAVGLPNAKQASTVAAGQMALGALEQLYNQGQEEAGTPVSPLMKGLQSTATGVQGVAPNVVGKMLTSYLTGGKGAANELRRLLPGVQSLPAARPNETDREYIARLIRSAQSEVAPQLLAPDTGTAAR